MYNLNQELNELALDVESVVAFARTCPRWIQQWWSNTLAWLHTVIASVVRDTWVVASRAPESQHKVSDSRSLLFLFKEMEGDPTISSLAKELSTAHGSGEVPSALSLKT